MRKRMEDLTLLGWYWSMNSANNEKFGHSQLGAHLPHFGFSRKTLTKHLQLHLPCFSNSKFENGNKRTFGPNKFVWSLDSLYP